MDMVKKNLFSIICGVVALAAAVACFWPVGGMYSSLQAELDKRAAVNKQVEDLRTTQRNLPSLVLENNQRDPLTRFPNEKVVAVGKQKTAALTDQSNRMLATVSDRNVHKLLVPGSLPRAASKPRSDFPEEYLSRLGQTEQGWETGIPLELHATHPPSPEEITQVAEGIWDKTFRIRVFDVGGTNNLPQITQEFQAQVQDLPRQEREKRANEHLLYLDEDSLAVSPDIQIGKLPTDPQIWFAQSVLWVEEDVAAAINAANAGAKNVLDAPVKHLVSLRVPFGPDQYVLPSRIAAAPGGVAPVALENANGVPEVFAISPTGRVSNPIYDVIHFDLVLRVDYRKIPQVLIELERNRLFTVLSTSVSSVDAAEELRANGYMYGSNPVAEIALQCEALFLRSWTVDKDNAFKNALMPDIIKETVGAKEGPGLLGSPGAPGMMPGGPGEMPPGAGGEI